MRILVVASYLPYPLFSGGHVRLYNILKELSKRHSITLVCEKRHHQTEEDVLAVKKFCKEIYTVNRKKQWSPETIFQTAVSAYPFLLSGHALPEMKKILEKLLRTEKFDVVHIETFYVYQNLPKTYLPTVLVEHNIEYSVYQRFTNTAPLLLRPLLQIDVEKIKYWEKKTWRKVHVVVGVSSKEAQAMRLDAYVVPNGVDLATFPFKAVQKTKKSKLQTILFMGDFKWIQNKDAASWIVKEIFPRIQSSIVNNKSSIGPKLWIVGKHIPDSLKALASESVVFDEHAPDKTSDIYKKADVLLAPIRVGGGTSYKILEAMCSGVPVVTTRLGIEGLGLTHGRDVLVGQTAEELAKETVEILSDVKTYESVRKNARQLIEEKYSWTKITKTLEGVYKNAIEE